MKNSQPYGKQKKKEYQEESTACTKATTQARPGMQEEIRSLLWLAKTNEKDIRKQ